MCKAPIANNNDNFIVFLYKLLFNVFFSLYKKFKLFMELKQNERRTLFMLDLIYRRT